MSLGMLCENKGKYLNTKEFLKYLYARFNDILTFFCFKLSFYFSSLK